MWQHVIRRLSRSARHLRAKARKLPRPWPFVRLLATRPRTRATGRGETTLAAPSAAQTLSPAGAGTHVVAVWPDALLSTHDGREAFERWHREVTNAGLLHAVEVRREATDA